jgi:hypothetical protein
VDRVRILCLQLVTVVGAAHPRKFVVRASVGKTVVAHGQDLVVAADYAGSDLSVWILGPESGQVRDSHKILVPGNIIFSLIAHVTLPINNKYLRIH